jgi:hypothetical protein
MGRMARPRRDWDAWEREQLVAEAKRKAKRQAYRQRTDVKAKRQEAYREQVALAKLSRRTA